MRLLSHFEYALAILVLCCVEIQIHRFCGKVASSLVKSLIQIRIDRVLRVSEIDQRRFLPPASPDFVLHFELSLIVPFDIAHKLFHYIRGACCLAIATLRVLGHRIYFYREVSRTI